MLFFLTLFLVIGLLFLGAGVVTGLLLHWAIPSVDTGTGMLVGLVSAGLSAHFFGKLIGFLEVFQADLDDDEEYVRVYPVKPPRTRGKRK
jgi:hypothetical protein